MGDDLEGNTIQAECLCVLLADVHPYPLIPPEMSMGKITRSHGDIDTLAEQSQQNKDSLVPRQSSSGLNKGSNQWLGGSGQSLIPWNKKTG